MFVGYRQGDGAGPGTEIHHVRRRGVVEEFERDVHEDLRLGPGDEHPGAHREHQMAEALLARQVLQRRTGAAQTEGASVRAGLCGAEPVLTCVQGGAIGLEDEHHQRLGAHLGGLDPMPFEVPRSAPHDLAGAHRRQSPSADSWAARSAARSRSAKPSSCSPPASTSCS